MAKVTAPLLSMSASGQIGQAMTFDKRGFVRAYVIPANPQTADQMTVRNILGDIQRELKQLGAVLRPQVKAALGYRWNTLIINELMANNHANFDAYQAAWNAFTTGKTGWVSVDPGVGLVNAAGGCFYAVAKAFYDVNFRITGDGLITAPVEGSSSTNGSEWIDDTP